LDGDIVSLTYEDLPSTPPVISLRAPPLLVLRQTRVSLPLLVLPPLVRLLVLPLPS
jgi:hypothetical protein